MFDVMFNKKAAKSVKSSLNFSLAKQQLRGYSKKKINT